MTEYKREYPMFSLCGLNCGLCPNFQTEGASKCPGCGGEDFALKHPSCKVINCSKKHGQFEYCFQCPSYPCEKYLQPYTVDSFITYANVRKDMEKAQNYGIENYKAELDEKLLILEYLLTNFNDGRRKNYYCLAVNLLDLPVLQSIHRQIVDNISGLTLSQKEKINLILPLFEAQASAQNIEIKLRK
jgi:hypothetical protein